MKFYYFVDKEGLRQGPLSLDDLYAFEIKPTTLVWCKGMEKWTKARDVEDFKQLLIDKTQSVNEKNSAESFSTEQSFAEENSSVIENSNETPIGDSYRRESYSNGKELKKTWIGVGIGIFVVILAFGVAHIIGGHTKQPIRADVEMKNETGVPDNDVEITKETDVLDNVEITKETDVPDNLEKETRNEVSYLMPEQGDELENDEPICSEDYIPSSPVCTVRGRVQGFSNKYTLVIGEYDGQVCPGGGSSEGIISDVSYDPNSGSLDLTICNMSGKVVGYYEGYLSVTGGTYKYSGDFVHLNGRRKSFSMSGH